MCQSATIAVRGCQSANVQILAIILFTWKAMMRKYRLKTTIDSVEHVYDTSNAITLRDALNEFESFLYDDYCYSFAMRIPIDVKIIDTND